MQLNDLLKSVSEMSDDELEATLAAIRQNRFRPQETVKAQTRVKKTMKQKCAQLTPEQKAKLLKELGIEI